MKKLAAATLVTYLCTCLMLVAQLSNRAFSGKWYSSVVHSELFDGDCFKRLEISDDRKATYTIFGIRGESNRKVAFVIMEASGKVFEDGDITRCVFNSDGFEFAVTREGNSLLVDAGVNEKQDLMTDGEHSELSKLFVVE